MPSVGRNALLSDKTSSALAVLTQVHQANLIGSWHMKGQFLIFTHTNFLGILLFILGIFRAYTVFLNLQT
jgi:hypothetical protein